MSEFRALKVSTELDGKLAVIEFDHGKANEVGTSVIADLEALPGWLVQAGCVAAISWSRRQTSRGTPIFVAGADVAERTGWDDDRVKAHVRRQRAALTALRAAPVFHVALVHGIALGWGTEYMLCCDWRIATPGAAFGLPETGLGILPGAGGTSELWAQIGVAHTLRLGMTGERIGADEAHRIGLVQELAADADAGLARARDLAAQVAQRSPTALAAFKSGVLASVGVDPAARLEIEALAYERCVDAGEAAIGRAHFGEILKGVQAPWGPRVLGSKPR